MKFLGMGWPELLIILVVILLIFGPKNLPKIGKALGKTVKNVRDGIEGTDEMGTAAPAAEPKVAEVQADAEAAPAGADAVDAAADVVNAPTAEPTATE